MQITIFYVGSEVPHYGYSLKINFQWITNDCSSV